MTSECKLFSGKVELSIIIRPENAKVSGKIVAAECSCNNSFSLSEVEFKNLFHVNQAYCRFNLRYDFKSILVDFKLSFEG